MELEAKTYGDVVVVLSPMGRIDHTSAADFESGLMPYVEQAQGESSKLVLDLAGVDYMSSVGLRVLMKAAKVARGQQGTVVISGLGPTLKEIFEISRFNQIFQTFDTARDAIAEVDEGSLGRYDADNQTG